MSYILDTDHITLYREGNRFIARQVAATLPNALYVTVISFQEQVEGWLMQIRRSPNQPRLIWAYGKLQETLTLFARLQVLPYDEAAAEQFRRLQQQRIHIGTQDLRIASIALANGCTVITRNRRDFAHMPGLAVVDWSVTSA
jgi:tRNA(fMet)-specific endonuclease VapC